MDSKITMILEILSDGKWHRIDELQQRMGLDEHKLHEVTMFLITYDFAKIDEENRKVKIKRDFQKFMMETVA